MRLRKKTTNVVRKWAKLFAVNTTFHNSYKITSTVEEEDRNISVYFEIKKFHKSWGRSVEIREWTDIDKLIENFKDLYDLVTLNQREDYWYEICKKKMLLVVLW